MRKILFPTDFSAVADNAYIYALALAKRMEATLITMHAYQIEEIRGAALPNTLAEIYESIQWEEFENYKDYVPHLRQIAQDHGFGEVPQYHVLIQGRLLEAIISVASEEGVDLIVMGTKGASGLKEVIFGSVTGEVMEHAPAPVLAVPKEASFDGKFDRIAVTTEFAAEEKKALYKVLEFASWFDHPTISVIHVDVGHVESIAHRMEAFKKEFEGKPNLEFVVVDATTIEKGLQQYLETHRVDILCMLTHKRGVLEELFNYSVAKKMSYHLTTPVLAIQAELLQ